LTHEEYLIRVFEKNYARVYKYVYKRIGDKNLTEDIAIDVFVEFIKFTKKRYAEDSDEVRRILTGIAKNLVKSYYKKEFKNRFSSIDENVNRLQSLYPSPESDLEKRERLSIIADVLENSTALNYYHRMCIFMHFFLGKSYREIARDLGISISQVRSNIEYGKMLLKNEVERKMGVKLEKEVMDEG